MTLIEFACPYCLLAVEELCDNTEQKVLLKFCPRCNREVEMIRLPGGRLNNAVELAKEREKK